MSIYLYLTVCALISTLYADDKVKFPSKLYFAPGEDFKMSCSGFGSASVKIYAPHEKVPDDETILRRNARFEESAERTTTINEYENASEDDAGLYTCLVMHGPDAAEPYSLATCLVVVKDLCADKKCDDLETCKPNYETGTSDCVCDIQCSTAASDFDPFCTDTCELMWHNCHMKETMCLDKVPRKLAYKGFCQDRVEPTIRVLGKEQVIEDYVGQPIVLHAGIENEGTPKAEVQWTFFPADGSEGRAIDHSSVQHNFVLGQNTEGKYTASITQCRNADKAVVNSYKVMIKEFATPITDNLLTGAYPVCSIFPGGAIEAFSGVATYYDTSCTHVLAADVLTGGNYIDPWFVYGTFDKHEGKGAMQSMSFYIGNTVFEIQRGWVVNLGGEKMKLKEDIKQDIPNSGCSVTFRDRHLALDCPPFLAFYDGVMSGHIKIKQKHESPVVFEKSMGSFGLCYDAKSGVRKNWQVGNTEGSCTVDTEAAPCGEADAMCDGFKFPPQFVGTSSPDWGSCGNGLTASCNELHCGEDGPTKAQECSMKQADRVNCELKYGDMSAGPDADCPEEECVWKLDIVSRGCPQEEENLPFEC